MIKRFGVSGTETDGIFFTEVAEIPGSRPAGRIDVKVGGQNKDLREVKSKMAERARTLGANAIARFEYGQRGNPWYRSLTGLLDHEHWYGAGTAVVASDRTES